MSSEWAVRVHDLGKTYKINTIANRPTLFTEAIIHRLRHPLTRAKKEMFDALDGVDMDVQKAETVGIIGRNGAGKSTLLKILSRIVEPTRGRVELYGQVGSLLEVGTGFHPELTGRENVYLNGAILGMKKKDIDREFDSIIDFAEIEQFLDTPVKRYSSGMYVRLAFAVAAHLNPEILIVDEVLAVGDAAFQRKCLGKMGEVSSQDGRTVLFVSHNMAAVESFCRRGIYLEQGRVAFDGDTRKAIDEYLGGGGIGEERGAGVFDLSVADRATGSQGGVLKRLEVQRDDGSPGDTVRMGDGMRVIIDVEGLRVPQHGVACRILTETDVPVVNFGTAMKPLELHEPKATPERVVLDVPHVPLLPGKYWIEVRVQEGGGKLGRKNILDRIDRAAMFEVVAADVFGSGFLFVRGGDLGVVFVEANWQFQQNGLLVAESTTVSNLEPDLKVGENGEIAPGKKPKKPKRPKDD
jgi:lipopolysaccharide transport system ATP-binding protein